MNNSDGWMKRQPEEIITAFGSDKDSGLDVRTVRENYKKWGKNALWYFGNPFMFLRNESGFSVLGYIILAISAFAAAAFDICDDAVLIGITIIAGLLIFFSFEVIAGIVCSGYCEKWIPHCTVIRGGKPMRVRGDSLVPGDIVILKRGDTVCADLKLIYSDDITVKEPPFSKHQGNVPKTAVGNMPAMEDSSVPEDHIYAGSEILSGFGKAVVCAIGTHSVLGSKGKIRLTPDAEPMHLTVSRKKGVTSGTFFMIFSFASVAIGVFSPLSNLDFVGLFLVFLSFAVSAGGEIYPSVCCIMYTLALARSREHGITVRDAAGADFLMNCKGVAAESASLMKSGEVDLKLIFTGGKIVETGNSDCDELFSLLYVGSGFGKGKYSREIMGALYEHTSENGDFDRFVSGVQTTKPLIDHTFSGHAQYSLYASGADYYFTMIGSIDDVIKHCTKISVGGHDIPLDKPHIEKILETASDGAKNATYLIAVAVRRSPYNSMKRLSVLTADLTFVGFVAVDAPAEPTLPSDLAYLKRKNIPFFFFSDGSGEDVNFARRAGIINSRNELVSAKDPDGAVEYLLAKYSNGGVVTIDGEEMIQPVLESAVKHGKRVVYIGQPGVVNHCGFYAVIGEPVAGSGAAINVNGRSEISAFFGALRAVRDIASGFAVAQKYIFISSVIRGLYAVSVLFGFPFVYPSAILIWGTLADVIASVLILIVGSRKKKQE